MILTQLFSDASLKSIHVYVQTVVSILKSEGCDSSSKHIAMRELSEERTDTFYDCCFYGAFDRGLLMLRRRVLVLCHSLFVLLSLCDQSFDGVLVMQFPRYDCRINFLLRYCLSYRRSQLS